MDRTWTDYTWKEAQAEVLPAGYRVALRLADDKEDISYGLGYYSPITGWTITARENSSADHVVAWSWLPER